MAVRARSVAINRCALPIRSSGVLSPDLLAVRRSLARRGAIAGKLRLHDVGYPVGFRLNDSKNHHRDREKHGQDQNSETPFLKKAPLSHATRRMGNAWMPPQSGCTRACIAQGAGYPRERLHIDGTEKRGGFVLPRCPGNWPGSSNE